MRAGWKTTGRNAALSVTSIGADILLIVLSFLVGLFLYGVISDRLLDPWQIAATRSYVIGVGFVVALIAAWNAKHDWVNRVGLVAIGSLWTLTCLVALHGTPFGFYGVDGDANFYTAMVLKHSDGLGFSDHQYKGLTSFYPPLYFWLTAKLSTFFGLEAYESLKYGVIFSGLVFCFVGYRLWRLSAAAPVAFAIVVFGTLIQQGMYKPHNSISATLFVPWWLFFIVGIKSELGEKLGLAARLAVGGLLGGLLFMTYYYWFFVGGLGWLLYLAYGYLTGSDRDSLGRRLSEGLATFAIAALVSSVFWAPFLLETFNTNYAQSFNNRHFSSDMLSFPNLFENSLPLRTALVLLGLVFALIFVQTQRIFAAALALVTGIYAWVLLGEAALFLGVPIMHVRSYVLLGIILCASFFVGFHYLKESRFASLKPVWVAVMFLVVVVLGDARVRNVNHKFAVKARKVAKSIPVYADERFQKKFAGKVFLESQDMLPWMNVYTFIGKSVYFNHPAAQFKQRLKFLKYLEVLDEPELAVWLLRNNRFDQIDYIRKKSGQLEVVDENFPFGNKVWDIDLTYLFGTDDGLEFEDYRGNVYEVPKVGHSVLENATANQLLGFYQYADEAGKKAVLAEMSVRFPDRVAETTGNAGELESLYLAPAMDLSSWGDRIRDKIGG